jgi:ABC-type transport system involved in multi-copper enzyme maturation permease subunit
VSVRDIVVIARFELWRHLRSRHGMVSLLMLVLFCGLTGWRLAGYADEMEALSKQAGSGMGAIAGMIEGVTELPATAIARTLEHHPPVLVALFALVILLLPIWTLVTAYDQTASDIETKHVRYLLFRSDRASIYLGKSLGALLLVGGSLALALGVLGLFLALESNALDSASGLLYLFRIWLTAMLFTIPFIALLGAVGALVGRARRTVSATVMIWIGVNAGAGIAKLSTDSSWNIEYLYPTTGRFNLMVDDLSIMGPTVAYLGVFSVVALSLGLLRFKRRDL